MDIIEHIKAEIANLLNSNKIELVDITYRREGGRMVLRLLVDKANGITLDDCSRLNEEIGTCLDEGSIMPGEYLLEVNSPGLDRPLKTRMDFERVMGKRVNIHTYVPIREKRDHRGQVAGVDDESVTIDDTKIPLNKISKAKLEVKI